MCNRPSKACVRVAGLQGPSESAALGSRTGWESSLKLGRMLILNLSINYYTDSKQVQ